MGRKRELDPWEPDPKWSKPRTEAWIAYRDTPDATIRSVAQMLGKSATVTGRWSTKDDWPGRRAAWHGECDKRRREEFHVASADVAHEQAKDAAMLRGSLLAMARKLASSFDELCAEGKDPFEGLTGSQVVNLMARIGRDFGQLVQAERLAHGLSTDNVAGHDGGPLVGADVAEKSPEQIEAYLLGRADAAKDEGALQPDEGVSTT